jgi:hypothetical protein
MPASSLAWLMSMKTDADGVVDAWWFCGRLWAFDYRRGRLEVDVDPPTDGAPLGFLRGANGELQPPFPRVTVRIEGDDIDMLLDTGATVELTGAAQQVLKRPRFGASSFVVDSIFDRWHRDHPSLAFVAHASTARSSPFIQVPEVRIGAASRRRAGSNGAGTPTSTPTCPPGPINPSTAPWVPGCTGTAGSLSTTRRPRRRHLTPTLPGGRRGTHRVRAPQSAVRRRRVAIVSVGCVAALLLLWLSFAVPPPWPWWVRAAAFVAIPASFFTTIAVELSVTAARTERGLSPQEGRRRRLAAWREVAHDITPLITWPWLYVRPLHRARERWRTHPRKRPPDGP